MKNNRMYEKMMRAARSWLDGKDPWQLAERAGVAFDGRQFRWNCLGTEITVSYPGYEIMPELSPWLPMVVLHYLNLADGTPLTGRWITFGQQKDGLIRGGGFDHLAETRIPQFLQSASLEEFAARCRHFGGIPVDGTADYSVVFTPMPRYPILLNLWMADEEFPASGKLLLDSSAEHYLTIEDSVALGETLLSLWNMEEQV